MAELKRLYNERKYLRKVITQEYNLRQTYSEFSAMEKTEKLAVLQSYSDDMNALNIEIQPLLPGGEKDAEEEFERCREYKSKIIMSISILKVNSSQPVNSDGARSILRSPIAPLPRFTSGEGEDLTRFFLEFEDTISKYRYTEYDKLILLKQQLSGRALTLVNSLEADMQGYAQAKALLQTALASHDVQVYNTIKQFVELKLKYNVDPFEYISKIRLLTENVKKLSITTGSFLQYFIWAGLNESFQEQLIQITNKIRPSLDDINDNFFVACERYQLVQNKFKERRGVNSTGGRGDSSSATSFAANVNYNSKPEGQFASFRQCSLCPASEGEVADHPIYKCIKYPDAISKITQLAQMKGCTKCGYCNHQMDSCRYRFTSRCRFCNEWHQSFLCNKSKNQNKSNSNDKKHNKYEFSSKNGDQKNVEITNRSVTVTEVLRGTIDSESILPTFTCIMEDKCKVRCLKDCGSQANFISEELANSLNLRVLKNNIDLSINGINTTQIYKTKLVQCHIGIGSTEHKLEALCIPQIDICLNLPNLGNVVQQFQRLGFKLADDCLNVSTNNISDIQFILGTSGGYCIPETEIVFGQASKSVYSETPCGVLLRGNISQILCDVKYLNSNSPNFDYVQSSNKIPVVSPLNSLATNSASFSAVLSECVPRNFEVLNDGKVVLTELNKATDAILEDCCNHYLQYDREISDDSSSELNNKLVKYALDNVQINSDGRLVMPLLWNSSVSHLLGKNKNLSEMILKSNLKKLRKDPKLLKLMDSTFREQEDSGIIERIDNYEQFASENPNHSFLAHMGVFKLGRETTKCRVVFLSNLCERDASRNMTISHNQAIHSGPSLNQKLSSSLIHLRFDPVLLCFDIAKAFNCIALNEIDQNRLLFFWFRNVDKGDFTIVPYKHSRLNFGIRCSPTLLLLSLYYILILQTENDSPQLREMKGIIYQLTYMDNLAVTAKDYDGIVEAYRALESIFKPYGFPLQQFISNNLQMQEEIDRELSVDTEEEVQLLGLNWNRTSDSLSTRAINLDSKAQTKRTILSSIASQFDLYNFNGPLLNRARIFLHNLQCDKTVGWDNKIAPELYREWVNIVKQANAATPIQIPRFVGNRDSSYRLIAFSDSSKLIFGVVIFIQDMSTNSVSFLIAKNRIVNKQMETKSIPSLEMKGIVLATECLTDLYGELAGNSCVRPIKIEEMLVYTDSLVCLSWLNSCVNKLDKLQKQSVFIMNRLHRIEKMCEKFPITYKFVSGLENPADCMTRCLSHKQLAKTSFVKGPDFLKSNDQGSRDDILTVVVPNPFANGSTLTGKPLSEFISQVSALPIITSVDKLNCVTNLEKCSSFLRLRGIYSKVLLFVNKLKSKLKFRNPDKYTHLTVREQDYGFVTESTNLLFLHDQSIHFPDIVEYFGSNKRQIKDIPNIVSQLNIYVDSVGLLRVRSKFGRMKEGKLAIFPVLISKESKLTKLFVLHFHHKMSHAGCYSVLNELRRTVWIPHCFSIVKKILKGCITCRRFKQRPVQINQSPYRENRINPPQIPYRFMYMDFLGPFHVKLNNGQKTKVYILCITCMFTRAINLKVCLDQGVKEFLRAFQLHSFEFGVPTYVVTDLGTQFLAGSSIIQDFLKDPDSVQYFEENNLKPIKFEQYYKGRSELGSMVESCVKLTKRLLFGAIRNNILNVRDFEYIVCQTVHLVNKRPVAFKESLRDSSSDDFPCAITPESLVRGHDLMSVNLIPQLQPDVEPDPDWKVPSDHTDHIRNCSDTLRRVRTELLDRYHKEFLVNLIEQAVSVKDRYKPVPHKLLSVGDIVLIKEPNTKMNKFPMGIIKSVTVNVNDEVTGATVLKGSTKEIVKRHVTTLIPLLTKSEMPPEVINSSVSTKSDDTGQHSTEQGQRPKRKEAIKCRYKMRQQL